MSPTKDNYARRREAIVTAAARVLAQKGFAASNKEIAAEAGLTAAALYWYFENKEALLRAVIEQFRDEARSVLARITDLADQPPRAALLKLAEAVIDLLRRPLARDLVRIVAMEAGRHPGVARAFRDAGERVSDLLVAFFERQIAAGVFRNLPAEHLAHCFMSPLITAVFMQEITGPAAEPQNLAAFAQQHTDVFLTGALDA